MIKQLIVFLVLFCPITFEVFGQPEPCGTDEIMSLAQQTNPEISAFRKNAERKIQDYINNNHRSWENEIITIPTVIHIIYHNDEENLPDSIIYSQMDVLNEDFRRLNADTINTPDYFKPVASDMRFEFCLATRDPEGNPTNGITRTYTDVTQFAYNSGNYEVITRMHFDSKGGKNIWNRDEYMNVWVINLNNSSGVLAFAYLPGADPAVDGIVCDYEYFGKPGLADPPYGLGRTMTHEVGHWLNLYHTFNDSEGSFCSDDFVEDTPPQLQANFTCYTFPHSTCDNVSDMYMNYMDYPGDDCTNMFTIGQTARSHAAVHIMRSSILNSTACQPIADNDIKLSSIDEPFSSYCFSNYVPIFISIKNNGLNEVNSLKIGYSVNEQVSSEVTEWTGSLQVGESVSGIFLGIPEIPNGLHLLKVFTYLPNEQPDSYPKTDTLAKMITIGAGIPAPFTETFTTPFPDNGWSLYDEANAVPWQQIFEVVSSDGQIGGVMSVKNDFSDYFEVEGSIDDFFSPNIDLLNFSDAQLSFDVSYRFTDDKADALSVLASPFCSPPYEELFNKSGATLSTRTAPTPQSATDWRTETIDLTAYAGQSVHLLFRNTTAGGNWLMIDNIRVTGTEFPVNSLDELGIGEIIVKLFPNPVIEDKFSLFIFNPKQIQDCKLEIFNIQGQKIWLQNLKLQSGQNILPVNISSLRKGIYFVQFHTPDQTVVLKLVK